MECCRCILVSVALLLALAGGAMLGVTVPAVIRLEKLETQISKASTDVERATKGLSGAIARLDARNCSATDVHSAIEATKELIIQVDRETRRVLFALLESGQLE